MVAETQPEVNMRSGTRWRSTLVEVTELSSMRSCKKLSCKYHSGKFQTYIYQCKNKYSAIQNSLFDIIHSLNLPVINARVHNVINQHKFHSCGFHVEKVLSFISDFFPLPRAFPLPLVLFPLQPLLLLSNTDRAVTIATSRPPPLLSSELLLSLSFPAL